MQPMKKIIFILVILVILAGAGYYIVTNNGLGLSTGNQQAAVDDATPIQTEEPGTTQMPSETVIGTSLEGNAIRAYHYGTGDTNLLFVGGIHGGYEWNTVLVAYELIDYLEENPEIIPRNVRVTVVPVLNPDGLNKSTGHVGRFPLEDAPTNYEVQVAGRYNARTVDLNRNFDCQWTPVARWGDREVDAGAAPFSEPESLAMKNYIEANTPDAVVVWYSAANGVYASSCDNGVLDETRNILAVYAEGSGYPAHDAYEYYETAGDMTNWLAKIGVPAISVLLSTHEDVEWDMNKKGFDALLEYYAN